MNNFINLNGNDQISSMDSNDLDEFLKLLNNYELILREKLDFDNNITFGMEIECERVDIKLIEEHLNKIKFVKKWLIEPDESLKQTDGLEFISPIYKNEKYVYQELRQVCNILKRFSYIGKRAGGHIHIGAHLIENENNLYNLINFWLLYEHIIFRFTNGEFLYSRPNIYSFAIPLREEMGLLPIECNKDLNELKCRFIDTCIRLYNIKNLKKQKLKNTIEFRCPNGTLDSVIWQNNLNFFVKFIEYSKNTEMDHDEICKLLYSASLVEPNNYYKIYLKEAIYLCDQIFDKNIDKIYFLKQYLKNFEVSTLYIRSKKFTK